MEKKYQAEELAKQLIDRTNDFERHLREEEKEIMDKMDEDIKILRNIAKEDDLGF